MVDQKELHSLEQVRANLIELHGRRIEMTPECLVYLDMETLIAPLETLIAWGRLNWTYGMSNAEAKIIMLHWHSGDGCYNIDSLERLDEVVQIARAIKKAFPARDVNRCAQRAAFIGSIAKLKEAQDDATYLDAMREQSKAILTALESP